MSNRDTHDILPYCAVGNLPLSRPNQTMKTRTRLRVCASDQLMECEYISVDVLYAGKSSSVVVFRYAGDAGLIEICVSTCRAGWIAKKT